MARARRQHLQGFTEECLCCASFLIVSTPDFSLFVLPVARGLQTVGRHSNQGGFFGGFLWKERARRGDVGSIGKLLGEHEVAGVCPPSTADLLAKERSVGKRIFKKICVFWDSNSGKKDIFSNIAFINLKRIFCFLQSK